MPDANKAPNAGVYRSTRSTSYVAWSIGLFVALGYLVAAPVQFMRNDGRIWVGVLLALPFVFLLFRRSELRRHGLRRWRSLKVGSPGIVLVNATGMLLGGLLGWWYFGHFGEAGSWSLKIGFGFMLLVAVVAFVVQWLLRRRHAVRVG